MLRNNDTVDLEFWRTDDNGEGVAFGCQLRLSPAQARELLKREARSGFGAIYSLFGSREAFLERLSEKLAARDKPLPAQPQVRMKIEAIDENGDWQPVQTSALTSDQATELAIANMLHGEGTLADAIHDPATREQILRWCQSADNGET